MCGIAGFWQPGARSLEDTAREMALRISNRGPDSAGEWSDAETGIALAHRRLSIIDLSVAGHQPMLSADGRYALSYNGEIYNHFDIREEIEKLPLAPDWRGHSDTETLLETVSCWGIEAALSRFNGMFAFALWDRQERKLYLARDRMGEKPLYYGHQGKSFLFGSELKALRSHPQWQGDIDRDALALYFRHNAVPAPYSIYRSIKKLPPAHYVAISDGGRTISEPICYWNLEKEISQGQSQPLTGPDREMTDRLEALLMDAVGIRMAADVPLGAFLSGGFDSSTVVALMQAQSNRPVRTFSIGFNEAGYNEAEHAKAVADHLGTDHTELYVTPEDALSVIHDLPEMWDEPFADSSQIPTYLVSKLAREHVTVSLSGDGGDELFYGYGRYTFGNSIWKKLSIFPAPLRAGAARLLATLPPAPLNTLMGLMPGRLHQPAFGDKLLKLAEVLAHRDGESFYRSLVSHHKNPAQLVIGATEPPTILTDRSTWPEMSDFRERMMFLDAKTYLHDDILTKVDRASMAVSLEARVPLLDHRVVEFAFSLPMDFKLRNGQSKWLLREVLYRHVPRAMMERPKMGFGVPIEEWLRGPLRDWAEDLLNEKRLREQGYLNPEPVRKMWQEHLSGKRRWHYYLWDILMFQAWLEAQQN